MREVRIFLSVFLLFSVNFVILEAERVPQKHPQNVKNVRIFEATIDLNSKRKPKSNAKLTTLVKVPTKNVSDYGDYEDYELTKGSEDQLQPTFAPSPPGIEQLNDSEESLLLESPKPRRHPAASVSAMRALDELSRLMGDPHHRNELPHRTTVTHVPSTTPTAPTRQTKNEVAFFKDEEIEIGEGSGFASLDDVETSVQLLQQTTSTSKKPLQHRTTIVQEVSSIPPTASPDPFENVDYDLSTLSDKNQFKQKGKYFGYKKKKGSLKDRGTKLHGGAVGEVKTPEKPKIVQMPAMPFKTKRKNQKNLKKLNKIDKLNRIRKLNNRQNTFKKMNVRKVLPKPHVKPPKFVKRNFVGSTSLVTTTPQPRRRIVARRHLPFVPIDQEFKSLRNGKTRLIIRQKRDTIEQQGSNDNEIGVINSDEIVETVPIISDIKIFGDDSNNKKQDQDQNHNEEEVIASSAGGDWDTSPIEISVLTSMKEQQPYIYMKEPTQVEPSNIIKEQSNDEFFFFEYEPKIGKTRVPLTQVTLNRQTSSSGSAIMNRNLVRRNLKEVGIQSMKKVVKKRRRVDFEEAEKEPRAKKPSTLNGPADDMTIWDEQWS